MTIIDILLLVGIGFGLGALFGWELRGEAERVRRRS